MIPDTVLTKVEGEEMTWEVVSFEQSKVDWEWRGLDAKAREVGPKSSGQEPLCFPEFAL